MKLRSGILFPFFLFSLVSSLSAQVPAIKWSKYHSFTSAFLACTDVVYDAKPVSDHGFVVVGCDTAYGITKQKVLHKENNGFTSIIKFDSSGNKVWEHRNGNPSGGAYTSVLEIAGGDLIAAGYNNEFYLSDSALYISKYTSDGQNQWNKTFGGSLSEKAYGIASLSNNGYLVAGVTRSNNGNVSGNHGSTDAWLIKVDDTGNLTWQKCFGGTGRDTAYAVTKTSDSGFIIVGSSTSSDGDLTGNRGGTDGWVFKINSAGNLVWQKNFGGSNNDMFNSITASADGNYIVTGYTNSQNGDITGNHGQADVWMVKIDPNGNLIWSKCFGGTADDYSMSVQRTLNNEFLIAGFTESSNGDVSSLNGGVDMWTAAISSDGNIIWQKCIGTGGGNEFGIAAFRLHDNEYLAVGSGPNPALSGYDANDILLVKMGNTNTIKGTVFLDANSNGIKDPGESAFDKALIKAEKGSFTSFAVPDNSQFKLTVDSGIYTTTISVNNLYYTVQPVSCTSTFNGYFNMDSISFAVQPLPPVKDLVINIFPLTPARPGFTTSYKLVYQNVGTATISNTEVFFKKDARLSFSSYSVTPTTINDDTLTWLIGNLAPLDNGSIILSFTAPIPPNLNNGDKLVLTAWISPVSGDQTPADDTAVLKHLVTGSYDPNDKTEANAGVITPAQVNDGDYLNYVIRFQNTGTDTAFTVYVRDTLNTKLDRSTFQMVSSSHNYNLQIAGGDKITWTFSDIKLPDSTINEPGSHGYIAYRIKPKSTVAVGDTIHNYASIYFDYNLPVITNNAWTLVANSAVLPVKLQTFDVQANGTAININWKTATELNVNYFDLQRSANGADFTSIGKVTAMNKPDGASYSFIDATPIDGYNYYRLKTTDLDGNYEYSTIKLVNTIKGINLISSVFPNPGNGKVTLKLQGSVKGNVRLQIVDNEGRQVFYQQMGVLDTNLFQTNLNLQALRKGNYILKVFVDNKNYLHKLIIQ